MANPRVRCGSIFDNSAVDLFWFRPARDRDRQVTVRSGNRPIDHEPFIHQTDRVSSRDSGESTPQGFGLRGMTNQSIEGFDSGSE